MVQLVIKEQGEVKGLRLPWNHLSTPFPAGLFWEELGVPGWNGGAGASPRGLQDLREEEAKGT